MLNDTLLCNFFQFEKKSKITYFLYLQARLTDNTSELDYVLYFMLQNLSNQLRMYSCMLIVA
jgi:hypothetical protein